MRKKRAAKAIRKRPEESSPSLLDILATPGHSISLTPDEQLAFWNALSEPVELTPAQRELGKLMRGATA